MIPDDGMSEILRRLVAIEHQVTSLDETVAFSARPNREQLLLEADKIFGKSRSMAQVYLACNGVRSVNEIGIHTSVGPTNASPALKRLEEESLIDYRLSGKEKIYFQKRIGKTIGLVKHLTRRFGLTEDGLRQ